MVFALGLAKRLNKKARSPGAANVDTGTSPGPAVSAGGAQLVAAYLDALRG